MNEKRAFMFGIAAVLFWSTVATAFKLTLATFTPVQMLTAACGSSVVALSFIVHKQGKWAQLLPTFKKSPRFFMLLAALNPLCYYLILFRAYDLLPASQAQTINYSWAITLTLMAALFLGQRLRIIDGVAALLCYFGVMIIATKGNIAALQFDSVEGVALALFSTLLWAGYWILNRKNSADPVVSTMLSFTLAFPAALIISLFSEQSWAGLPIEGWLGAVYIGFFEMGITFYLWLTALKLTEQTARLSNLIFISPFISLMLLATIIGEEIHPSTLFGLIAIIAGLLLQQYWPKFSQRLQRAK